MQTPCGFNGRVRDALGQRDIERDEENIGHGQLAEDVQRRLHARVHQVPLDQRGADGFDVRREEREDGDDQRQEDVGFPERLQAGDDADLAEAEDGQEARTHQRGEPCDRVEDQEGEGSEAKGHSITLLELSQEYQASRSKQPMESIEKEISYAFLSSIFRFNSRWFLSISASNPAMTASTHTSRYVLSLEG